ncbi:MAG: DeoR/GlpR transcriptional regulator [Planctomycetaceae bacterium]|nr:MAG: DeoR/GlpR transcriptional regulator [Planctomycetaceae bacterium]
MLLDQRRQEILNLIESLGFASLPQLAGKAGVSESTVRRDLEQLERMGQVRRTRGGAAYVGDSIATLDERSVKSQPEKQLVGRAAAELVQPGETILLDGGTTTLEVARHLIGKSLQVATNSLPVVNLLASQPQIELLMIGGYLYPKTGVALGPLAIAALSQISVRRLFMSVGGITPRGLYNSNTLLADTERAMLNAAEEVIVVTDSSKLGHSALAHLCELGRVDRVVVDAGITCEWKSIIEDAGVSLTIAEGAPAAGC